MIIDFHTHVFYVDEKKDPQESVRYYLRGMKETPVEKFVVLPVTDPLAPFALKEDPLYSLLEDQHHVYFMATLQVEGNENIDEDIERIKKLLKSPKFVGVKLYPGYEHYFPADERLDPLYSYLSRRRIPILFHSGETWGGVKRSNPRYSHPLNFYELAELYPNLRFILAHVGYPWFIDTAELLYEFDNAYADLSDTLPAREERFWKANMDFVRESLIRAYSMVGDPTRFLFSTDWVGDKEIDYKFLFDYYRGFIEGLPLLPEEREKVMGGIAEELFFGWKD